MPVDLSRVGLEGLESYSTRQYQEASSKHLSALADQQQYETQKAQRLQELDEQASQMLTSVAQRKNTGNIMDGVEEDESSAAPLERIAEIYLKGGAPEQGMEYLSKASNIRKQESDIESEEVNRRQNRLETILKGADIVGRVLGGAQNEDEWAQGLKEVEEAGVIEPELMEKLKNQPFDPDVAAYFKDRAISAAQQATLDMQMNNFDQRERFNAIRAAQAERRAAATAARVKEQKRHNLAMEKNAGGNGAASAPSAPELASVHTALKNSIYKGVATDDNEAFNSAAQFVAAKAKELVKQNKALDWDTAVQQATMIAQNSGAFTVDEGDEGFLGMGKRPKSVDFQRSGKTLDMAIPLPSNKSQLSKGKYYITARGRAKWNGTAFEAAE